MTAACKRAAGGRHIRSSGLVRAGGHGLDTDKHTDLNTDLHTGLGRSPPLPAFPSGSPGALRAMQLHMQALFVRDPRAPTRLLRTNEWDARAPPWLFLGRTPEGNLWRFHADLPPRVARALAAVCQREPVLLHPPAMPVLAGELAAVLQAHGIDAAARAGPAFWLPEQLPEQLPARRPSPDALAGRVVPLLPGDAARLRGGLEDWTLDLSHRQPIFGVLPAQPEGDVAAACAVAICASVRITAAVHAAGVETVPAARGQGHARTVVAAWAAAVRTLGALPMYSTTWDNLASQRVAAALGAVRFGVDFQLY